ncbi:MAG: hypothetical protein ACQKBU_04515 [Verrucomicrobiales bacterium]
MTTWINITVADLEDRLVGAQISALRTAALASGQDDPVEQSIEDVTHEIRTRVAQCKSNRLSATAGAIPPVLKRHACALIIEEAQMRIPALELSDDQVRMANNARKVLDQVSTCKFDVEMPDDPISTADDIQQSGGVQLITDRTRQFDRKGTDGLL